VTRHDPMERLRGADPAHGHATDPTHPDAVAMRDAIMAGSATPLARRRRRRRWITGAVAAGAAAATAAALAVATSRVEDPTRIGCYDAASTQASTAVIGAGDASPVELCRELWRTGQMDPGVSSEDQVPPLIACVIESGITGVFPAESCDDVVSTAPEPTASASASAPGSVTATPVEPATPPSPPPPSETATGLSMPDFNTDDVAVRRALDEIRRTMLDRCLTLDAAVALAEGVLEDHGLEGWTVGPLFEDQDPTTCAGFFPDAPERDIRMTPEEPDPGQTPSDLGPTPAGEA
jgi:hypothetical protein